MKITSNHIIEFLALLTSLVNWRFIKRGSYRWLPLFLFFILGVELTGNYLHKIPYANIILYNFSIPVEYCFYMLFFYLQGNRILSIFTRYAFGGYLAMIVCNFMLQPLRSFHSYSLLLGQVIIIVSCCIYYFELFRSGDDENLLRKYFFWLASGLLLFNLGDLTYNWLYPMIHEKGFDKYDTLFRMVNNSLLFFLYLAIIISILILRNNNNKPDVRGV